MRRTPWNLGRPGLDASRNPGGLPKIKAGRLPGPPRRRTASATKRPAYVSRTPPERAKLMPRDMVPVWRRRGASCPSFRGFAGTGDRLPVKSRTLCSPSRADARGTSHLFCTAASGWAGDRRQRRLSPPARPGIGGPVRGGSGAVREHPSVGEIPRCARNDVPPAERALARSGCHIT